VKHDVRTEDLPRREFMGDFDDCSFDWKQWFEEHDVEVTHKGCKQNVRLYSVDSANGPVSARREAKDMLSFDVQGIPHFIVIEELAES